MGILLALGRRSDLPVLRWSTAYIELMRAVPLIAVLFFGQLLIPLFLPQGLITGFCGRLWLSLVCSGLHRRRCADWWRSSTQREAAAVLGLSPRQYGWWCAAGAAVALPSLTNQAVGLLQNTSLMAILGLVELLGISRTCWRILRSLAAIWRCISTCCGLLADVYGHGSWSAPGSSV